MPNTEQWRNVRSVFAVSRLRNLWNVNSFLSKPALAISYKSIFLLLLFIKQFTIHMSRSRVNTGCNIRYSDPDLISPLSLAAITDELFILRQSQVKWIHWGAGCLSVFVNTRCIWFWGKGVFSEVRNVWMTSLVTEQKWFTELPSAAAQSTPLSVRT